MTRRSAGIRRWTAAFSLLEVMVAMAILGVGLTVILTAQTGLFSSTKRAAQLSQAVGLARCRMSEIEVQLLKDGFSLTKEEGEGPCCEDEESELRCKWSIIPVTMPELSQASFGADAGASESDPTASVNALGEAAEDLGTGETTVAVDKLNTMGGASPNAGPSMGASALAPVAMSLIYPQLKGMLEASIRKVTVQVLWSEGLIERDLSVTQYITNPQQGGLLAVDETLAPGATGTGGTPPMREER